MKQDETDELSFISLAALTANVLQHLGLNQKKNAGNDEHDAGNKRSHEALKQRELRRLK